MILIPPYRSWAKQLYPRAAITRGGEVSKWAIPLDIQLFTKTIIITSSITRAQTIVMKWPLSQIIATSNHSKKLFQKLSDSISIHRDPLSTKMSSSSNNQTKTDSVSKIFCHHSWQVQVTNKIWVLKSTWTEILIHICWNISRKILQPQVNTMKIPRPTSTKEKISRSQIWRCTLLKR